jgi:hypothetical protein
MNERIQELAEQADLIRVLNEHAHEYGNGTFDNTLYPELEKFAELIVQECAKVAEEYDCNLSGNGGEILEHFGVEE